MGDSAAKRTAQVIERFNRASESNTLTSRWSWRSQSRNKARALGGFFQHLAHTANFFLTYKRDIERKIGVRQQRRNVHEFVENILKRPVLGRATTREFGDTIRRHAHQPFFDGDGVHEAQAMCFEQFG